MFSSSHHTVRKILTLQAANVSHAELADERGVLAKRLLHSSPAWIARDIEHRGQTLLCTNGAQLPADHIRHSLCELGLKCTGDSDHLGIHAAAQHHGT